MKTLFLSPLQPQNAGGGFCGEKPPGPWWAGPQALGARAPSPLETWPTGPWGLDPATLTDFLQAKFSTSCCVSNPCQTHGSGSQNATITPNPLGVGWFPKAELYSSMRGGVPVFAHWGRAPSFWKPGQQAPEPCIPVKNSKNAPCSSAHEKPGLLHRLISCAQFLQPSLSFLLRLTTQTSGP